MIPKKLSIDSLKAELTTLNELLRKANNASDVVGSMQLECRIDELTDQVQHLTKDDISDNAASVALYFGGKPVLGSKGIASEFAGNALTYFQNLISKIYATRDSSELAQRGRIPKKSLSELMVTNVVAGSFGFVLSEMTDQFESEDSELTVIIERAIQMLQDTAVSNEENFEQFVENLDPRTLIALKDIFVNLDSNEATLRIVEKETDITLDTNAIHLGRKRTEEIKIEEKTYEIEGVLQGFLPEHRKFELIDNQGNLLYGSASKHAVEQFKEAATSTGSKCIARLIIKTVIPLNRPPKEVHRLVEFLRLD